jgi:hypothetical protein
LNPIIKEDIKKVAEYLIYSTKLVVIPPFSKKFGACPNPFASL